MRARLGQSRTEGDAMSDKRRRDARIFDMAVLLTLALLVLAQWCRS